MPFSSGATTEPDMAQQVVQSADNLPNCEEYNSEHRRNGEQTTGGVVHQSPRALQSQERTDNPVPNNAVHRADGETDSGGTPILLGSPSAASVELEGSPEIDSAYNRANINAEETDEQHEDTPLANATAPEPHVGTSETSLSQTSRLPDPLWFAELKALGQSSPVILAALQTTIQNPPGNATAWTLQFHAAIASNVLADRFRVAIDLVKSIPANKRPKVFEFPPGSGLYVVLMCKDCDREYSASKSPVFDEFVWNSVDKHMNHAHNAPVFFQNGRPRRREENIANSRYLNSKEHRRRLTELEVLRDHTYLVAGVTLEWLRSNKNGRDTAKTGKKEKQQRKKQSGKKSAGNTGTNSGEESQGQPNRDELMPAAPLQPFETGTNPETQAMQRINISPGEESWGQTGRDHELLWQDLRPPYKHRRAFHDYTPQNPARSPIFLRLSGTNPEGISLTNDSTHATASRNTVRRHMNVQSFWEDFETEHNASENLVPGSDEHNSSDDLGSLFGDGLDASFEPSGRRAPTQEDEHRSLGLSEQHGAFPAESRERPPERLSHAQDGTFVPPRLEIQQRNPSHFHDSRGNTSTPKTCDISAVTRNETAVRQNAVSVDEYHAQAGQATLAARQAELRAADGTPPVDNRTPRTEGVSKDFQLPLTENLSTLSHINSVAQQGSFPKVVIDVTKDVDIGKENQNHTAQPNSSLHAPGGSPQEPREKATLLLQVADIHDQKKRRPQESPPKVKASQKKLAVAGDGSPARPRAVDKTSKTHPAGYTALHKKNVVLPVRNGQQKPRIRAPLGRYPKDGNTAARQLANPTSEISNQSSRRFSLSMPVGSRVDSSSMPSHNGMMKSMPDVVGSSVDHLQASTGIDHASNNNPGRSDPSIPEVLEAIKRRKELKNTVDKPFQARIYHFQAPTGVANSQEDPHTTTSGSHGPTGSSCLNNQSRNGDPRKGVSKEQGKKKKADDSSGAKQKRLTELSFLLFGDDEMPGGRDDYLSSEGAIDARDVLYVRPGATTTLKESTKSCRPNPANTETIKGMGKSGIVVEPIITTLKNQRRGVAKTIAKDSNRNLRVGSKSGCSVRAASSSEAPSSAQTPSAQAASSAAPLTMATDDSTRNAPPAPMHGFDMSSFAGHDGGNDVISLDVSGGPAENNTPGSSKSQGQVASSSDKGGDPHKRKVSAPLPPNKDGILKPSGSKGRISSAPARGSQIKNSATSAVASALAPTAIDVTSSRNSDPRNPDPLKPEAGNSLLDENVASDKKQTLINQPLILGYHVQPSSRHQHSSAREPSKTDAGRTSKRQSNTLNTGGGSAGDYTDYKVKIRDGIEVPKSRDNKGSRNPSDGFIGSTRERTSKAVNDSGVKGLQPLRQPPFERQPEEESASDHLGLSSHSVHRRYGYEEPLPIHRDNRAIHDRDVITRDSRGGDYHTNADTFKVDRYEREYLPAKSARTARNGNYGLHTGGDRMDYSHRISGNSQGQTRSRIWSARKPSFRAERTLERSASPPTRDFRKGDTIRRGKDSRGDGKQFKYGNMAAEVADTGRFPTEDKDGYFRSRSNNPVHDKPEFTSTAPKGMRLQGPTQNYNQEHGNEGRLQEDEHQTGTIQSLHHLHDESGQYRAPPVVRPTLEQGGSAQSLSLGSRPEDTGPSFRRKELPCSTKPPASTADPLPDIIVQLPPDARTENLKVQMGTHPPVADRDHRRGRGGGDSRNYTSLSQQLHTRSGSWTSQLAIRNSNPPEVNVQPRADGQYRGGGQPRGSRGGGGHRGGNRYRGGGQPQQAVLAARQAEADLRRADAAYHRSGGDRYRGDDRHRGCDPPGGGGRSRAAPNESQGSLYQHRW